MCDTERLTPNQLELAGKAARRLLDFGLANNHPWELMKNALQLVCRTFQTNVTESTNLLRRWLEPDDLAIHAIDEMKWIAKEIKWVIPFAPDLVRNIYKVAFAHKEEARMSVTSRIHRASINTSMFYDRALLVLIKNFPYFLKNTPVQAAQSLISAVESYRYGTLSPDELVTDKFPFNGCVSIIKSDYSNSWDSNSSRYNQEMTPVRRLLNTFEEYFCKASEQDIQDKGFYKQVINTIASDNVLAVLWRRLIICGTKSPKTIGQEVRSLAWTREILLNQDTTNVIGNFIKTIFIFLEEAERKLIEETILLLPNSKAEERDPPNYTRNRLLSYLSFEFIVTEEAKALFQQLANNNKENEFDDEENGMDTFSYGHRALSLTERQLQEKNISELEKLIQELIAKVDNFNWRYLGPRPSLDEIKSFFPLLQVLYQIYKKNLEGIDEKYQFVAWNSLVQACQRSAKAEDLPYDTLEGSFVYDILLEASQDYETENSSWWYPRSCAALGLTQLSRFSAYSTEDLFIAVEHLSIDPAVAVRSQVAEYLHCMHQTNPNLMWQILDEMSTTETDLALLKNLIYGPIQFLVDVSPNHIALNIQKIL